MKGDNEGRVVRWDVGSEGVIRLRVMMDGLFHGYMCTIQTEVPAAVISEMFQVSVNQRELEAQSPLW